VRTNSSVWAPRSVLAPAAFFALGMMGSANADSRKPAASAVPFGDEWFCADTISCERTAEACQFRRLDAAQRLGVVEDVVPRCMLIGRAACLTYRDVTQQATFGVCAISMSQCSRTRAYLVKSEDARDVSICSSFGANHFRGPSPPPSAFGHGSGWWCTESAHRLSGSCSRDAQGCATLASGLNEGRPPDPPRQMGHCVSRPKAWCHTLEGRLGSEPHTFTMCAPTLGQCESSAQMSKEKTGRGNMVSRCVEVP
jgi:hypothetical protein